MKKTTKPSLVGLLAGALFGISSFFIPNHASAEPIKIDLPSYSAKPAAELPDVNVTVQNPGDPKYFNFGINGEIPFSKSKDSVKIEYGVGGSSDSITKARLAVGNNDVHVGVKYQNLSGDATLLNNANLWEGEFGTKDLLGFFTGSLFAYTASFPDFIGGWNPSIFGLDGILTPVKLSGFGLDLKINPKFDIGPVGVSPLLFMRQVNSISSAKNTQPLFDIANGPVDSNGSTIGDSSFSWPFNRVNMNAGLTLLFKGFDLGYNIGLKEAPYGAASDFTSHFEHKINAGYHGKEVDLEYLLTINRFTTYLYAPNVTSTSQFVDPKTTSFDSKINFEFKLPWNLYLKSMIDINSGLDEGFNTITALGYSDKKDGLNLELFYNKNDRTVGISFSTKSLEGIFNRNDYTNPQRNYLKQDSVSPSSVNGDFVFPGDVNTIHSVWGNTLQDAIAKIKSDSHGDYHTAINLIERFESYFAYGNPEHNGTLTAPQEYNTGNGVCRDTNGQLLPTVINGVLGNEGYSAWGISILGSYLSHEVTIIKKPNGRYDLMQYNLFYETNAKTVVDAIDAVFPGFYMIGGGRVSPAAQEVLDAVYEGVWK